jgi:DNA-binding IclR family transcriptional regulator
VTDSIGRQGLPRIPGLGSRITTEAHCLAIGKVFLADIGVEGWLGRTGQRTLRRFTAASITDPERLDCELDAVRRCAVALDRSEFTEVSCCVAAPVRDAGGRLVAALGVSVPARRFPFVHQRLVSAVHEISERVSACQGPVSRGPEASPTRASADTITQEDQQSCT